MHSSANFFLKVKDYSVSEESFELIRHDKLDLLATYPQPDAINLSRYYQSDDYISHTDSKRSLFENVYHFIRTIALKNKLNLIASLQKANGTLLDIGAGTGDFLIAAKNHGWDIIGIEPSDKARAVAMTKGASFIQNTTDLESSSCDIITMWHVLEHVPNYISQIKELKRLLKPDGTILIAVPNFKSFDAQHYGEFWAGYDVPRHLWHFSKTAVETIVASEDLQLVKTVPLKFDAYYVALLSEKYKSGKMNYFNALITGLKSNYKAKTTNEYSSHIYIIKHRDADEFAPHRI